MHNDTKKLKQNLTFKQKKQKADSAGKTYHELSWKHDETQTRARHGMKMTGGRTDGTKKTQDKTNDRKWSVVTKKQHITNKTTKNIERTIWEFLKGCLSKRKNFQAS